MSSQQHLGACSSSSYVACSSESVTMSSHHPIGFSSVCPDLNGGVASEFEQCDPVSDMVHEVMAQSIGLCHGEEDQGWSLHGLLGRILTYQSPSEKPEASALIQP